MIEISNISKESLSKLGIYELRELARQVGVKSPTTKLRSELCDTILKIKSGEIEPNIENLKKGRPPKSINKSITITNENETYNFSNFQIRRADKFNQTIRPSFFVNQVRVEGYLIDINHKLYFYNNELSFDNLILIEMPSEYVAIYQLRKGDKIVAICDNSNVDKYIVKKVLTINNIEIEELPENRNCFNTDVAISSDEQISILDRNVKIGEVETFKFDNESEAILKIANVEDNFVKLVVGGELVLKDYFLIQSNINFNCFISKYGEDLRLIYNNTLNSINFAESMLKDGKKVVIYFINPQKLLSALDMYYSSTENTNIQNSPKAVQLIKRILGSARAISDESFINVAKIETED